MPSDLERKCLSHLDAPDSWSILRREKPEQMQVLPWSYFRRVFGFNFLLFGGILTAIFFFLETTSGMTASDIRADLPLGLLIVLLIAAAMGLYVTHLYRRSWNGRARFLSQPE
jgi:hypothetical protein